MTTYIRRVRQVVNNISKALIKCLLSLEMQLIETKTFQVIGILDYYLVAQYINVKLSQVARSVSLAK